MKKNFYDGVREVIEQDIIHQNTNGKNPITIDYYAYSCRSLVCFYENGGVEKVLFKYYYPDNYSIPNEKMNDVLNFLTLVNRFVPKYKMSVTLSSNNEFRCSLILGNHTVISKSYDSEKFKSECYNEIMGGALYSHKTYQYVKEIIKGVKSQKELLEEYFKEIFPNKHSEDIIEKIATYTPHDKVIYEAE